MKFSKDKKIFLAGHNGLVGSAIYRKLKEYGYSDVITINKVQLNLLDQKKVFNFLKKINPHVVIIAAARVGGILANKNFKADFVYQNLQIQTNLIHGSYISGVKNLIFLGSSCVYPRNCKQPIKEKYLLNGPLEKTNDAYAIAKIAGIKMCESYNLQYKTNYKCLMPCNVYGPNDSFDLNKSHFLPALINKIHLAKSKNKTKVKVWGNGNAMRELIYVDDLAEACIYFMAKKTKESLINIGTGKDYTIKKYVIKLNNIIYPKKKIKIIYDRSKPNGTPRKILDISLSKKYGWKPKYSFKFGVLETYKNFKKKLNIKNV